MPNEMTIALFHSEWGIQNDDYLQHYGIFGMHWGIRRYQPYGEGGYDPDHEGKNIGLAARLAGHTGSYSDAIKRGSSFGNRAKAAASSFGKRAGRAASEAVERFNYASDRTAQGILNAGRKARSGLAKYAGGKYDSEAARIYENAGVSDLAKGVFSRFSSDAKTKVSDLKRTSFDDVKSALGSGASRFQEAMSKTAVKSKEFGRNAAMTAALFGGALDPKNEGFTKVQARADVASGLSGKSSSLYSGWYEHESRMNPGQKLSELSGGRAQGLHSDALDIAGRLASSKYGGLSKTGNRMLQNPSLTRSIVNLQKDSSDRTNLGTYSPSAAIRLAGSGTSPINQKSTAPRWKGNDAPNLEARKRVYTGELQNLNSRARAGSQSIVDARIQKPYKDYERVTPKEWEYKDMLYKHRRDTSWSPDMPAQYGSKTGNMTNEEFLKRLRSTGNKIAPINQVAERRKTRPLDYGRSGILDRGSNSGVDREDVNLENVVDFRNRKMPQLVQTQSQLNRELKKRGVSFAMINNTPVPMIPKDQNKESVDALIKRLGIGTI